MTMIEVLPFSKNNINIRLISQDIQRLKWIGLMTYRSSSLKMPLLCSRPVWRSSNAYRTYTRARWKFLDLAYNRRKTRDKRPLGRDPDRCWCHCHTSVKHFFFVAAHGQHMGVLPLSPWWSHGLRPKMLYTSVEVTPTPVLVPTQRPWRLSRELFILPS